MDNNTPNDQNGSQDAQGIDTVQQVGRSFTKNNLTVIIASVVLVGFAYFMFSSIFSPPPKPTGPDLLVSTKGGKSTKVANAPNSSSNDNNSPTSMAGELPQPPVATLQPPPPPIETPALPTPVIPPPMIGTIPGIEGSKLNSNKVANISEEPPPPPPLPVPPAPEISNIGKNKGVDLKDKNTKQRIRSNMLLIDGAVKTSSARTSGGPVGNDPNSAFADSVIRGTHAEKENATILNDLSMTIAQGKIINAVLEVAINTDLPGNVRAIVSRDTYAESGRSVLIPKGSRLIGTYNTGILHGQSRVMIVWTRMIRPDGIDIMIGSPGVDNLGRAGVQGYTDNKFFDIFSAAILTTALTIGAAVGNEAILPQKDGATTTTTPEGNTTTTTTPSQQAAGSAVNNLGNTGKQVVQRIIDIRPTITLDQGTIINVFVNRDLTFPSDMGGGVFVQ